LPLAHPLAQSSMRANLGSNREQAPAVESSSVPEIS
jgi:hypothetical protein